MRKKGASWWNYQSRIPNMRFSAYYLLSSAEAASNLSRYDGIKYGCRSQHGSTYEDLIRHSRSEGFGPEVKRRILLGNYALSSGYYEEYYKKAAQIRACLRRAYGQALEQCDVLLMPTAPETAYKIGSRSTTRYGCIRRINVPYLQISQVCPRSQSPADMTKTGCRLA